MTFSMYMYQQHPTKFLNSNIQNAMHEKALKLHTEQFLLGPLTHSVINFICS